MEKNSKNKERQKEEALLTFLKQVKEEKYAEVDKSSLRYSRVKEQREDSYYEDEYYYGIR